MTQIQWNEDYIQQLIDQKIKESLMLEYKQCAALRETGHIYNNRSNQYEQRNKAQSKERIVHEISKDVSALANAAGGTIVYGIVEDGHNPLEVDQYPFLPGEITKEWLENVIDSNIRPKIPDLKIHPIEISGSGQNGVIYAVEIPQSLIAPHQANDYKYYQRFNFKAQPMEDYQVRDVMNRYRHPLIESEIYFREFNIQSHEHLYSLGLKIKNIGNVSANNFGLDIYFPEQFIDQKHYKSLSSYSIYEGDVDDNRANHKKLSYRNFGNDLVLFPSESLTILSPEKDYGINYIVNRQNWQLTHLHKLELVLFADNMPPKKMEFQLYNNF